MSSLDEESIEIGRKRIKIFLERIYYKLQLALSIEFLLENYGCRLEGLLEQEKIDNLLNICGKYIETEFESKTINSSFLRMIKTHARRDYGMLEPKIDPELSEAMYDLLISPAVRILVTDYSSQAPPNIQLFLDTMQALFEIVKDKLMVTAEEERQQEIQLYRTWRQNKYYLDKIQELTTILKAENEMVNIKLSSKRELIDELTIKMSQMNESSDLQIMKIMNKSEIAMSKEASSSEVRRQELEMEAQIVAQKYQQLLDQHLAEEKVLRVKRYKVETQLSNWLNKYDAEVGELQQQLELVKEGYDSELATFKELQKNFNEQEVLYNELMAEKEEEEKFIFAAKCYQFILNRSARRIQRWWRAILARRKMRRKKPKKKAKK